MNNFFVRQAFPNEESTLKSQSLSSHFELRRFNVEFPIVIQFHCFALFVICDCKHLIENSMKVEHFYMECVGFIFLLNVSSI